jgi:hypothetical protein
MRRNAVPRQRSVTGTAYTNQTGARHLAITVTQKLVQNGCLAGSRSLDPGVTD